MVWVSGDPCPCVYSLCVCVCSAGSGSSVWRRVKAHLLSGLSEYLILHIHTTLTAGGVLQILESKCVCICACECVSVRLFVRVHVFACMMLVVLSKCKRVCVCMFFCMINWCCVVCYRCLTLVISLCCVLFRVRAVSRGLEASSSLQIKSSYGLKTAAATFTNYHPGDNNTYIHTITNKQKHTCKLPTHSQRYIKPKRSTCDQITIAHLHTITNYCTHDHTLTLCQHDNAHTNLQQIRSYSDLIPVCVTVVSRRVNIFAVVLGKPQKAPFHRWCTV